MQPHEIEALDVGAPLTASLPMAKKTTSSSFDTKSFLAVRGKGRTHKRYRKDEIIFSQGDPADAVIYVLKGKIKRVVTSQKRKKAVVAIFGPGDFFGEGCLIGQPLRLATTSAMAESEVVRMEKNETVRLLQAEPLFAEMFMTYLLIRISHAEENLVDQLINSTEKRLARTLLFLARLGDGDTAQSILTNISQATLADIVGTTRPRVNFFMNKFKKLGLVDYSSGSLKINSSLLRANLHD